MVSFLNHHLCEEATCGLVIRPLDAEGLVDKHNGADTSQGPSLQRIEYPNRGYITYWALVGLEASSKALRQQAVLTQVDVPSSEIVLEHIARFQAGDQDADPFELGFHVACAAQFSRLPRHNEIFREALEKLFDAQRETGLWERRYPTWASSRAGEYHPSSFELLSTLLTAFDGDRELFRPFLPHLERSVRWLESNRICLNRRDEGEDDGEREDDGEGDDGPWWNAGVRAGEIRGTGQHLSEVCESWVTAEAFTFLHLLDRLLTDDINADMMSNFGKEWDGAPPKVGAFDDMIGDIANKSGEHKQFGPMLASHLCEPLSSKVTFLKPYSLSAFADRRRKVRSGLLFGPPGTGKTTFAERTAEYLGWPLLALDPGDFTVRGIDSVPARASEIFDSLRELEDVVVLFDEMEEFIRSRAEAQGTSYVQRVWTTSFLPKLQDLRDHARVIFFVATNYYKEVDPAIKRMGRFDFLVSIPVPSTQAKLPELRRILTGERPSEAGMVLEREVRERLDSGALGTLSIVKVEMDTGSEESSDNRTFADWFAALSRNELTEFAERSLHRVQSRLRAGVGELSIDKVAMEAVADIAKDIVPHHHDFEQYHRLPWSF